MPEPLSDIQIYDRLHAALAHLSGHTGQTPHGDTTIKAAIKTLSALQLALVMIEAKGEQTPQPPDPGA